MDNSSLYDEKVLLQEVAEGDQKAFTKLVDRYWNKVYGHTLAYAKSALRAKEITQDVFLHVWNKRQKLREVENFKNYLFILGRNQIISSLRKKLNDPSADDPVETWQSAQPPDRQLEYKQAYHIILEAIEKLPPVRKAIFKMSRLDGLSYEEIALKLNISKNTVKGHIVLALAFLRTYLHNRGGILITMLFYFNIF